MLAAAAVTVNVAMAVPAQAATIKPGSANDVTVSCGETYPDRDSSPDVNMNGDANLRTGPSTSCTTLGQINSYAVLDYYCYVNGQGGNWTFLFVSSVGGQGWVRSDLLPNQGSNVSC